MQTKARVRLSCHALALLAPPQRRAAERRRQAPDSAGKSIFRIEADRDLAVLALSCTACTPSTALPKRNATPRRPCTKEYYSSTAQIGLPLSGAKRTTLAQSELFRF